MDERGGAAYMDNNPDIYYKISTKVNKLLANSKDQKKEVLNDVQQEDTLAVILRVHLYAEKELDDILIVFFNNPKIVKGFSNKLNFLFNLQIMNKSLYDAVFKLNKIRNAFAHDLEYGKQENVYSDLKSGLSEHILRGHEIDVEMKEIIHGKLDEETKIRILLANIWIQLRIFSTSSLQRKYEFANRIQEEVIEEVNKEQFN